jgi:hypothetical protein
VADNRWLAREAASSVMGLWGWPWGRLEKKGRRKKVPWGPHVNKWRKERLQGQFGLYENMDACSEPRSI